MIPWVAAVAMTAVASVVLTVPLVRAYDARKRSPRATASLAAPGAGLRRALLLGGLGLGAAGLAVALYVTAGRPPPAGPTPLAAPEGGASAPHPGGDVAGMMSALEARMKRSPDDVGGWRMLGWSYMRVGRYAEAVDAYRAMMRLSPGTAEDESGLGEAVTRAAGGVVTPAATEAFRKAVASQPREPRARYYLALAKEQQGDRAGAMRDWIDLLRGAPADAPWVPEVRTFVEQVARADGEDIERRLPPVSASSSSSAAASTADPSRAMIEAMVDGLDKRLQSHPDDTAGWVRLLRSRMVLGESDRAARSYRRAWRALADQPAQQDQVQAAARALGVPGV